MSYSSEVLADAPLAYYRLGEASGTTMLDSSGNGRDGTYFNSPGLGTTGLLTGDVDTCVTFDGSDDMGAVAAASWQQQSVFTIEAVIATTGGDTIVARRDGVFDDPVSFTSWQLRIAANYYGAGSHALYFMSVDSATANANVAVPTGLANGVTYHVAATYDGADVRIYVNGALAVTQAIAGVNAAVSNGFSIGARRNPSAVTEAFSGKIDEVAYYGTALSGTRIAAHYAAATAVGAVSLASSVAGTASLTAELGIVGQAEQFAATLAADTALTSDLSIGAKVNAILAGNTTLAATLTVQGRVTLAAALGGNGSLAAALRAITTTRLGTVTADKVNGRQRSGRLNLRIINPLDVDATDEGLPAADGSTVRLHKQPYRIISPSLPAPTLVDGRPQ